MSLACSHCRYTTSPIPRGPRRSCKNKYRLPAFRELCACQRLGQARGAVPRCSDDGVDEDGGAEGKRGEPERAAPVLATARVFRQVRHMPVATN
jgi:hypothetical protein